MTVTPSRTIISTAICSLLWLAGCGTYRNMTAYFNTYYNASKLFDEAVAEAQRAPQPARDSNYFAPYKISQGIVAKFEKVIEKGSKVIQFHGESGYVEDAIMMIGKAYLYQNETESASGKFRELLENFPASDKRYEATLWYAKALYQGNNDQEALITVKDLTAERGQESGMDDDILLEAMMLEAQIYEDRGEYEQASQTLKGIDVLEGSSDLKTIALYHLGSVHEKTGDYYAAARAYAGVLEYTPTPDMRFNARLREGVMLSKAGESDLALETFDELIDWPLKPAESALVDYEIATAYWEKGDSASAFTLYSIIDSTYQKTDASARANFIRAEIMRTRYGDLASAKNYYQKAKSEFQRSPVTEQANRRFLILDHYFKTYDALVRDDSLFLTALHSDTTAKFVEDLAEDTVNVADTVQTVEVAQSAPDEMPALNRDESAPPDPRHVMDAISRENLDMRAIRLRPRHLVADLIAGLEDRGVSPPGGREGGGMDGSRKAPGGQGVKNKGGKVSKKPAAKEVKKLTPAQISNRIAANKYELGGIHFLDLDLPDSAMYWYRQVVEDHPHSPLVPKAFYAMSEIYRARGDSTAVDSLQNILLTDYHESEYAVQVLKNRGLDTAEVAEDPMVKRYREAEELLSQEEPEEAVKRFTAIYKDAKDTLIGPKACYAIGWIYENVLMDLDSADHWYRTLISEHPKSVYAVNAVPRVNVREDTSSLEKYVKFKEIKAVPKPVKKGFGLVRKEPTSTQGLPPGEDPFRQMQQGGGVLEKSIDEANEGDDEEVDEEEIDDDEPEEEEEEDDDPGADDSDPGLTGFRL